MASVRVEDQVHTDPRYKILGNLLGTTKGDAIYRMILLWEYCTERQTHFVDEITIDTIADFENFHELILDERVQLAERLHGKIRIKGTKGRIEWLAKQRKNGKKGGRPRKPKANPNETQPKPTGYKKNNLLVPALTPVLVPAPVKEIKKEHSVREKSQKAPSPENSLKIRTFIGAYVKAYEGKHGARPDLKDPKLVGQLSNYAKNYPDIERACQLIQVFFQMEEKWFETKAYDFATYLANAQKVALALDTGKQVKPKDGIDQWLENMQAAENKALTS